MLQGITARTARFGSGGVILRARSPEGLALNEIAARAPSIFAEDKHDSRSERFTYIPTAAVLQSLTREGFRPFEVRQGGSRDADKRQFTKHMVRLRHPDAAAQGGLFPEVIMVNAHDGTSSYQLMSGLFRMVCTNGLIAGTSFDQVRVQHKGDVVGDVIEGAYTVVKAAPALLDSARTMEGLQLSDSERQAFARAAISYRYEDADAAPITAPDILRPRRSADTGRDLWTTFNVAQEHLVQGGDHFVTRDSEGRRRRGSTRPVNGIDGNRDLNRALHTLAEEMRKLKTAA